MPLYEPSAVADRPVLTIVNWRLIEPKVGRVDRPTHHLVGYIVEERWAKVSSPVEAVQLAGGAVRTSTGRTYVLGSGPGHDRDALYTLDAWLKIQSAKILRDLTDAFAEALVQAARMDGQSGTAGSGSGFG